MQNDSKTKSTLYRKAGLTLLKLKSSNRDIFSQHEANTKLLEEKKEKVDKLLLFYENLKYKQSHLRRLIRLSKDLKTPSLTDIENELNTSIGVTEYRTMEDLQRTHEEALELLESELKQRVELEKSLKSLEKNYQTVVEKLDLKRKFLEELPTRMTVLKSSATEIQAQFAAVSRDLPAISPDDA